LDRFERFVLRLNEAGNEYLRLGTVLAQVGTRSSCLYPNCQKCLIFEGDCGEITNGVSDIEKSLRTQSHETSTELLESLKSYRDVLYGFQLLLQRRDMLLPQLSTVPTLRRISVNQNKLVEITAKGNVAQKDFDKISNMIEDVLLRINVGQEGGRSSKGETSLS
jgi:Sorting nexin 8/Mvp1 BAR domain